MLSFFIWFLGLKSNAVWLGFRQKVWKLLIVTFWEKLSEVHSWNDTFRSIYTNLLPLGLAKGYVEKYDFFKWKEYKRFYF